MLDRFYPISQFGAGKPQAHWLLDEAGAHLVAASLDLDRKQLAWQRRDDWRSHPQLAHRLEVNRLVTELIAATLSDPTLGLAAWFGPREGAARMGEKMRGTLRPDAELTLIAPAGPVDLLLEWDRGTETLDRLDEKLRRYRTAERKLYDYPGPRSILFVVPGRRRLANLRELCADLGEGDWLILATTATELRAAGPLGRIWQRLDADKATWSLVELPPRRNLRGSALDPANALGRRWRHDHPEFWDRLSPLGRAPGEADLHPSGIDGFMDDPEPDEEGSWR